MKMYMVGGAVRDEILGVRSKDIDFSVVLEEGDDNNTFYVDGPFYIMRDRLMEMGFKIFLETPEHLTVRAQFPKVSSVKGQIVTNDKRPGLTADFVLARKEGTYSDGRRPDAVEPGTLEDDLARRDFTMNAIAKAADGTLIDPHNGQAAIAQRLIVAVGSPQERLEEDALRALRALRFSVVLGFNIDPALAFAMQTLAVLERIENNISDERIQVELSKMFRNNTVASLQALSRFPALTRAMFAGRVSLDSTLKQKGRGK